MMAAIRTKFLTAPSQQLADMPAPPPQRGGRLLEGAARDPGQEEGHLEPSERGPLPWG